MVPARDPEDWKQFLAHPDKQWKKGYSARSLAYCWHEADGIPKEVMEVLLQVPALNSLKFIFIIPEHKVPIPGGGAASQNDIWVLGETDNGLISITVEGKVSEPFGPTVGKWFSNPSPGKEKRLKFLCEELGLPFPVPDHIRYQLLHRTVSAIIEARRLRTDKAAMIVHSFSPSNEWFENYQAFVELFGLSSNIDEAVSTGLPSRMKLHIAWVHGGEKYLDK
ncbi:DUF6946 family protein [uncultured Desulfobacter sp.]|uniref:DUF6946 family protein n=1 Tax=uncultured Desulfobacter sp. TaxID=240139 RepID=UPI0029F4A145|nr:hypothetical protein [uncultured Desulfobacter sp.]